MGGEGGWSDMATVMVMVATLTRAADACPLGQGVRCGGEGEGRTTEWGRMRESVCVWSGQESGEG